MNITDQQKITDKFNEFSVNIGPTLASKIPASRCDPFTYVKNGTIHSIRPVKE